MKAKGKVQLLPQVAQTLLTSLKITTRVQTKTEKEDHATYINYAKS